MLANLNAQMSASCIAGEIVTAEGHDAYLLSLDFLKAGVIGKSNGLFNLFTDGGHGRERTAQLHAVGNKRTIRMALSSAMRGSSQAKSKRCSVMFQCRNQKTGETDFDSRIR